MAYKDMEKKKVWEDANRERRKALRKQRYEANKEKELAACKAYQDANKDKRKAYIEANKADIVAKGIIYRTTHKEKTSAYMKRYYVENTEEIKARAKISRLKNAITVRAGKKVWYENTKHRNKDIRREYNKAWRERTLETRRKKARQYYYENKETIIERHQRHYVNNKSLYIARGAKRRAAKMKRTPTWLSPLDLWLMEEICARA